MKHFFQTLKFMRFIRSSAKHIGVISFVSVLSIPRCVLFILTHKLFVTCIGRTEQIYRQGDATQRDDVLRIL